VEADLVLIGVHLRRGELDRALAAVDRLEAKQPASPVPHNFRGAIYAAKRDLAKARASFERALAVLPGYYPALSNLARLDLMEKKPDAARKRLEAALQKDANNEQLLLGLAGVLAAARAPRDEMRATLERAVSANPSSSTARAALVDFHLRGRDAKAALAAAQAAHAALPEDTRVAEMLGVAQLAAGENQQAVATFGKLAGLQPDSAQLQLRLAAAYAAGKEQTAAIGALRKALELDPNLPGVRQQLSALLVAGGDPSAALAEARTAQRKAPGEPLGFALEGAVFAAQKKWPEAERAYRQALAKRATPGGVIELATALERQGKSVQADALTRDWIQRNGQDVAVRTFLAERALLKQDYAGAARLYKTLLELRPDDVIALNNLAWAAGNASDPEALRYAEQAYALAPQNPAVLDTYGMLLAARGEPARGVELLRAAVALAPELHVLRLNLAKALSDAGAKREAREELQRVIAQSNSEPLKVQARALLEKP
jgi:putative PEP-CTERM system TPR-repeat lipoprotein